MAKGGRAASRGRVLEGRIKIPYAWPAGRMGSRFLRGLRDEKKLWAIRCPACNRVTVPPGRCLTCDQIGTEWVEVGPAGVLECWTVVRDSEPGIQVLPTPYAIGLIRLEGADTPLVHLIGEVKPERIRAGMRVEPVFDRKRRAHILDIRYFRPADGGR